MSDDLNKKIDNIEIALASARAYFRVLSEESVVSFFDDHTSELLNLFNGALDDLSDVRKAVESGP